MRKTRRTANYPGLNCRLGQLGFTLIELIMVIVLIGVLSIYAAPRMFNSGVFYARGFHDETLALLRYAQKAAIAQRRTVCVTFTSTTAFLTIAAAATATSCVGNSLVGPKGDSPATITAKSGAGYSGAPTSFNFNGQGQPVDSTGALLATQTIVLLNAANVVVEAGTGYVHE